MNNSIPLNTIQQPGTLSDQSTWYGWVMVGVAALAMVSTLPGRTHGLGMITERLLDDPAIGISRTTFGQMNLWATLLGSLFCLGIGSLVDRYGIRKCLATVMLLLSLVVIAMARVNSPWTLFLAILLTRGLGQSALSVISITIVGKWFPKNVSQPMAIYSVLMAGGFIAAALVGRQYAHADWRSFWSLLGWCVFGATLFLTLLARDRTSLVEQEAEPEIRPADFTHAEAVRTPMFWVCAMSISLYGLIVSGVSLFNESILVDQGFTKEVYYDSLAWGMGTGVLAKLLAGWLGMRISIQKLLALSLLLLSMSLVWLTMLKSYGDVIGYVLLSAVAGGVLTVLFFSAWPQLYGQSSLGRIQGSAQMMTVVASAFGPLLFAQYKVWSDSYIPLIWILTAGTLLMSIIAWFTPSPNKSQFKEELIDVC